MTKFNSNYGNLEKDALQILKDIFGHHDFRSYQKDIILSIMSGRDTFAIMPTGTGKSICYQIPAIAMRGTAIVISPLIALMEEQVATLKEYGVRAEFINSNLNQEQRRRIAKEYAQGQLDLIYLAPERLANDNFISWLQKSEISFIAVDEAHCISQWGHDFRPEYTQIGKLRTAFPKAPVLALTATADERTRLDIVKQLNLQDWAEYVGGFDRPNIYYHVEYNKGIVDMIAWIKNNHPNESGIVYCNRRKTCEKVAKMLNMAGIKAAHYHAGLEAEERASVHQRFLNEEIVICATIAFGMGIDKSNVRFVCHSNLTKNIESYYQETGRAGRDGLPADAWMNYSISDIAWHQKLISDSESDEQKKREDFSRLNSLLAFAETAGCRRRVLLNYFGEDKEYGYRCGNCDNCLAPDDTGTFDGSEMARIILKTIHLTGQKYGARYIMDIIYGFEKDERITKNGHTQLATHGKAKELGRSAYEWDAVLRKLIIEKMVVPDFESYGVLKYTQKSLEWARSNDPLQVKATPVEDCGGKTGRKRLFESSADQELFDKLRALRTKLAKKHNIPPYAIFSDKVLVDMVNLRPRNLRQLKKIDGVGQVKLKNYGKEFLAVLHGLDGFV